MAEVATARGRKIVIHNCLTKADLRSLFISHMGFQFAQAECVKRWLKGGNLAEA